uniref:Uncharacterized protein n=1 Tax=Physcomitrium patens TaxID=3218 RepID=A0A2K1IVP1_PHYPA|nr:hypothetical protein PHYPA_025288 [Physcomitrium patens]
MPHNAPPVYALDALLRQLLHVFKVKVW